MKSLITHTLKVVVVISLMTSSLLSNSQSNINYTRIDSIVSFFATDYNKPLHYIQKKALSQDWDKVLSKTLLQRNIYAKIDTANLVLPFDPVPLDDYITEEDLAYMKDNADIFYFRNWKKKYFSKKPNKISNKRPMINHRSRKKWSKELKISPPLFSINSNIAIMVVETFYGPENGGGTLYIFEKKEGKWKHLCQVNLWIS